MMGFLTLDILGKDTKCDICKLSFTSSKAGNSRPYDDYSCEKCNWHGTICASCGLKSCPKCKGDIQSTHRKAGVDLMY